MWRGKSSLVSSLALGLREKSSPTHTPTHRKCKPYDVFTGTDQTWDNLIHHGTETSPVQSDAPVAR